MIIVGTTTNLKTQIYTADITSTKQKVTQRL